MEVKEELLTKLEEWLEKSKEESFDGKLVYNFLKIKEEAHKFLIERVLSLPRESIEEMLEEAYLSTTTGGSSTVEQHDSTPHQGKQRGPQSLVLHLHANVNQHNKNQERVQREDFFWIPAPWPSPRVISPNRSHHDS